jgi:hypothetical protein
MLQGLARVKDRLRVPDTAGATAVHPADRAAEIILALRVSGLAKG